MSKRARRATYWIDQPEVPRLRVLREAQGLSQKRFAKVIHERTGQRLTPSQIHRIEIGDTALTPDKAALLAKALDRAPADLYASMPLTVPLLYRVGLAPDAAPALQPPLERIAAPRHLDKPEECFAARMIDDSADELHYPSGSDLFIRAPQHLGNSLSLGERVLVAVFATTRAEGVIAHVLLGEFAESPLGDMLVHLRSSNRAAPAVALIRQGANGGRAAAEASIPYQPWRTSYTPRPTDRAEVLGRLEAASVPVRPPAPPPH